ncbi:MULTISPECIES: tyrosine-protein phosphatase [Streptomyces]|uniref:Tyrosine-protein phosphatase n=1 Tax=Streptomyces solicathayae TaxID=3081768 RepID=A0ABZ0LZM6_9ACTN|nr:tyrosine-protein phosphatase [Streptomyces sp. HUAS YS2]WOX24967.1 tyrosine-protein phosphatase [Streptomyces sp. HUAS YS2]
MPLTRRALLGSATATAVAAVLSPTAAAAHRRPRVTATAIRQIPLQGAVNVRDVGGYLTYTGDRVRQGLVYRGDALGKLTDADLTTLAGLGLGKVVDFRIPLEIQYDGADRLPAGPVAVSRQITDNGLFGQLMAAIGSRDPVRQEQMLGNGRAAAFMREVYRSFVTSAENRAAFGATLRDLARPGSGPLLYHCTSGKDRTGWTSYLLLKALGVPEQSAVSDYLASNTIRAAYDARVREGLKQSGMMQNPDLIIPLQEVRNEYLDTALGEVQSSYGSLFRFLTAGLGLDIPTLSALQNRLVA